MNLPSSLKQPKKTQKPEKYMRPQFPKLNIWQKRTTMIPEGWETKEKSPMTASAYCFRWVSRPQNRRENETKAPSSTGFKGFATCVLAAQKGPVGGFMLCCCHFEIQKKFWTNGPHFHFTLGPANCIAGPAWQMSRTEQLSWDSAETNEARVHRTE